MATDATEEAKRAAFVRGMHDEEIGVHHRMERFYLPLFLDDCRSRGIDRLDEVKREVLVLAIGPRRGEEVCRSAKRRR